MACSQHIRSGSESIVVPTSSGSRVHALAAAVATSRTRLTIQTVEYKQPWLAMRPNPQPWVWQQVQTTELAQSGSSST